MRSASIALGLASLMLAFPARAEIGRDDQWSYVAAGPHGGPAAELRGDRERPADHLLFRISCDPQARALVVEYFLGDGFDQLLPEHQAEPLELIVNERSYAMPSQRVGERMVGRLSLNAALALEIEAAEEISLFGPNDMGEPWYAGRAKPLRRVTRECL